jgi:hypothetical protein
MRRAEAPINLRFMLFSATRNEIRRAAAARTSDMSKSGSRNCHCCGHISVLRAQESEKEEKRTHLIMMRGTDKDDCTISGDVVCTTRTDFTKEKVDNDL